MEELTTNEMLEVQGGRLGLRNQSVGNVALAMNVDVNVLSGNGGGLSAILEASAKAGTISASAHN
jgi:hypothetical protein